jgi:lactate racemase
MNCDLAYGEGALAIELPEDRTTVIKPTPQRAVPDEQAAVFQALEQPIASLPLRKLLKPGDRVCIVFTDITRATPNRRLIPWLLEYLADVPPQNITLLNGLGTHRPNTPDELEKMLTPAVTRKYRVLNHEANNPAMLVPVGRMHDGTPALINRHLVEAPVRIITGFIEPHFFAGFSGGPKGILPGVAGTQSIISSHDFRNIGHPQAGFGVTEGNPLWEELRDMALRVGPSFLLNVALNEQRLITGVFAGDLIKAHRQGVEFVKRSAMQAVAEPYDLVVTTNSGYPLDLNLYQGVKGLSAGARILKPGGTLILAAECREGMPPNSPYDQLLRRVKHPREILDLVAAPGFSFPEQWQTQIQAIIQCHAETLLYSCLPEETVRAAFFTPCPDISFEVARRLSRLGPSARVAVLPQGPLTIPYLARG